MLMGEGKTTVIAPVLVLLLASTSRLNSEAQMLCSTLVACLHAHYAVQSRARLVCTCMPAALLDMWAA